jgi:hypothetical protein
MVSLRRGAAAPPFIQAIAGLLLISSIWLSTAVATLPAQHPKLDDADVVVYGSTPGGIIAAVAAARTGARTLLLDPALRPGGVCSGGLGATDKGNASVIGGLAFDFFLRNARYYDPAANATDPSSVDGGFYLEPHVAEAVFVAMLGEAGVRRVDTNGSQVASVVKTGTVLQSLALEDGRVFSGAVFVDGTYEGDLMARSGTSFTWGREPYSAFNESFAGRREPYSRMDWAAVSPFLPDGTLLFPMVTDALAAPLGSGDDKVQAYNFRLCVTRNESNRVPFPRPSAYNRRRVAGVDVLARLLNTGVS